MNILIPIAGPETIFKEEENSFSKPLFDILGKPLIEHIFLNLKSNLSGKKNFIFVANESDCVDFALDFVIKMLDPNATLIKVNNPTKGPLCSCLLAVEYINSDEELLIVNGDQLILESFDKIIKSFRDKNADGGIITFESIHPKWSYVKIDSNNVVIETSEKKPISKNASVGVYYYKTGKDFVKSAKRLIYKDINVKDSFYVSLTYNEMILENKKIMSYKIPNDNFFALDTPQAIDRFIKHMEKIS